MQSVVETPGYLKAAEAIFSQAERDRIVAMVAANPECGEVIQGTGGFRKVRVARSGMGKRGGARLIYILRGEAFPIFLISVYAKNEKENLTSLVAASDGVAGCYRGLTLFPLLPLGEDVPSASEGQMRVILRPPHLHLFSSRRRGYCRTNINN